MARLVVVESGDNPEKVPFLRGILTRSLQEAGLSFDEAYALASNLRNSLSDSEEVTIDELRRMVEAALEPFGPAVQQRYRHPPRAPESILIRSTKGETSQFSRQRHRRGLESTGLSYEEATVITTAILGHLVKRGVTEIEGQRLGRLTYRYLRIMVGPEAAQRYLVLAKLLRQERPVLIMIGGAPGTGKSALTTELAQRLEILRTQSTDLLREVMRMMMPERLLPVLHRSSYDAWRALPQSKAGDARPDDLLMDGFRAQAELLSVPCEAVVRRALRERTSLILEGVHVQRTILDKVPDRGDAVTILVTLAVLNPRRLRENFERRAAQAKDRRAERYLAHFDSIWRLQSHLLAEADQSHTPIIENVSREQVIRDALVMVVDHLAEQFSLCENDVFSHRPIVS